MQNLFDDRLEVSDEMELNFFDFDSDFEKKKGRKLEKIHGLNYDMLQGMKKSLKQNFDKLKNLKNKSK